MIEHETENESRSQHCFFLFFFLYVPGFPRRLHVLAKTQKSVESVTLDRSRFSAMNRSRLFCIVHVCVVCSERFSNAEEVQVIVFHCTLKEYDSRDLLRMCACYL